MDYEKKYKEALATARDLLHIKNVTNYGLDIDLLNSIFPELEENEDEKAKRIILALPFKHEEDYIFVKKWLEKQGSSSVKWQKNTTDNKPTLNHSVLMKNIHGIAEGEWNGKEWIQYKWSSKIKDSDVLYWMNLYELDKQGKED